MKLLIYLFILIVMNPKDIELQVKSTKECLNYIEANGLTLQDNNPDYSIQSGSGLVYTLPNGEFVLVPTDLEQVYPGIIFKNEIIFKKVVENDYFPIGEKNMTWLEANASHVKQIDIDTTFFSSILSDNLGILLPFRDYESIEESYNKVVSFVKKKSNSKERKESVVNSYGLAISCYLRNKYGYRIEFQKKYERYNPYYLPILQLNEIRINVISKLIIAIKNTSKNSFMLFSKIINLKE